MAHLAWVSPKSNKAKNRFHNIMDENPECIIEQMKDDRVFLTSFNGKNHFWVSIRNDKDWRIEF